MIAAATAVVGRAALTARSRSALAGLLSRQTTGFDPSDIPAQCQSDCSTVVNALNVSRAPSHVSGSTINLFPSRHAPQTSAVSAAQARTGVSTPASSAFSRSSPTRLSCNRARAALRVRPLASLFPLVPVPVPVPHLKRASRLPVLVPAGRCLGHPSHSHPALRRICDRLRRRFCEFAALRDLQHRKLRGYRDGHCWCVHAD